MSGAAWIDGRVVPLEQATLPITDRGFLLGDAVFETLRTRGGRPFLLGDHLDRLRASAEAVALPVPWSDGELAGVVERLLPERGDAVLRVTVTRGDGGHGLAPPEPTRPRLVALRRPLPELPAGVLDRGGAAVRDPRPVGRDPTVPARVKTGSYLGAVVAIRAARQAGAVEALVRGLDGGWIEGTTSNLFAWTGDALVAPGPESGALPGITRALVLALAAELFVTSTVKGLLPLVRLDGEPVGQGSPGPRTRALLQAFDRAVDAILRAGASRLAEALPGR